MVEPNLASVHLAEPLGGAVHCRADVGEVALHYVMIGSGTPVVLLHGFPEFWYSWRNQLTPLAEAGFRAMAPDLRGYNESEKPTGVQQYRVAKLVADVAGLIENVCAGPAIVVGHDWGGILAWRLAALMPRLVRKLVILNAPHPFAYRRELARGLSQWLRSSYAGFFQLPFLPEAILRAANLRIVEQTLRREPYVLSAFSDEDIDRYKAALGVPGGLVGPINYYRAAFRWSHDLLSIPQQIDVPTLLIWGLRDPFLNAELTLGLDRWVPDLRVERVEEASHWVQNEAPERVNELLIEFAGA